MQMDITDMIKYIGVDDTTIDLFENQYMVPEGVSYNSYIIMDEKITVMDTVDKRKMYDWEENLKNALDGRTPDYLVIQHMEPDHAGSIARFVELYPEAVLVGNTKTFSMLPQFFDFNPEKRMLCVKEGDVLNIGRHSLTFIMAPMVHWPEVMFSYESSEKILFSADAFGRFGAIKNTKDSEWVSEARRYYFNIVGKYGIPVRNVLAKAQTLDIACICPLHGPVLKDNIGQYINLYDMWSSYRAEKRGVLVAYASIHGNTADVARKMMDILLEKGEREVILRDLARSDMSQVISEAFQYDCMILAAASYDAGVFPCMQDFLLRLQSKAYQNRTIGIIENGSWAPTAGKVMKSHIEGMKEVVIAEPVITIKSVLKEADISQLETLAEEIVGRK